MYTNVTIDGTDYPVSFGMNALAKFTRNAGLSLKELGNLDEHLDLENTLILVWCGLADGFRKARKDGAATGQFTLAVEDVGDLLDQDSEALSRIMDVFNVAMPEPGNVKKQAPKKRRTTKKQAGQS